MVDAFEKLFHTLLGEDWQITKLEFDKDTSKVRLRITERPELLVQQRYPNDQRGVKELKKHSAKATQIECVSTDMSGSFNNGVAETCPQTEVVFDTYHLIAKTSKAVGDLWRVEICRGVETSTADWNRWGILYI